MSSVAAKDVSGRMENTNNADSITAKPRLILFIIFLPPEKEKVCTNRSLYTLKNTSFDLLSHKTSPIASKTRKKGEAFSFTER